MSKVSGLLTFTSRASCRMGPPQGYFSITQFIPPYLEHFIRLS